MWLLLHYTYVAITRCHHYLAFHFVVAFISKRNPSIPFHFIFFLFNCFVSLTIVKFLLLFYWMHAFTKPENYMFLVAIDCVSFISKTIVIKFWHSLFFFSFHLKLYASHTFIDKCQIFDGKKRIQREKNMENWFENFGVRWSSAIWCVRENRFFSFFRYSTKKKTLRRTKLIFRLLLFRIFEKNFLHCLSFNSNWFTKKKFTISIKEKKFLRKNYLDFFSAVMSVDNYIFFLLVKTTYKHWLSLKNNQIFLVLD